MIQVGLEAVVFALAVLALGGALVATEGNVEGILPWQLLKLQRLLILSGACFAFIGGLFVSSNSARHRSLLGSKASSLQRVIREFRLTELLLLLCIAGYILGYGWLAIERHNRFNSTGYDLAIKEQVIWNTAHGRFFRSSFEVENYFGDHFQPVMLALIPLYLLFPTPVLLLVVQTVALGVGAIPLYRVARRQLDSDWQAVVLAVTYLLYPALGFVNRFDFHPEVLAVPAFLFAYDALERGKTTSASLWLLIPLLSKENLGFSVAAVGLYAAFVRRRWRFGLTWAGVGVAVSLLVTVWLIPTVRHEAPDTLLRYSWLGESFGQIAWTLFAQPAYVWSHLVEPNRILYLLQLLVPTGFLAVPGLSELAMAIPGLAVNLLADHFYQSTIYCHYTVSVIPFVFIGAVTGLRRLRDLLGRGMDLSVVVLALLPLTLVAFLVDNPFTESQELPDPLADLTNAEVVRSALDVVPSDASVVTTNAYAPHLAQREGLYVMGIPATQDPPSDPDAVFLNLYDQRYMVCEQYREYLMQLDVDRYGVIFHEWGVVVVQRDAGSQEEFEDFVVNWADCAG